MQPEELSQCLRAILTGKLRQHPPSTARGVVTDEGECLPSLDFVDADSLDEAAARYARGDYPETLWNLEKALGRKFIGLGDLILGKP